jgi:hypothetical protein
VNNLTTLAAVKTYLGIPTTTQDLFISSLIPRASDQVQRYCGQEFPTKSYAGYKLNGTGTDRIVLPGPPVLSVSAVQIGSTVVTASPDGMTQSGYAFQDNMLYILPGDYGQANGGVTRFSKGTNNVMVSWMGGYEASETAFVPTGNSLSPSTGGSAAVSVGVAYTGNGVALVQVGSAPAVGQFTFNAGVYGFSTADYNKQVTMTYYYVPAAVEQSTIEMVGLKLKQRDNLGIKSKSLANETISYEDKGITPAVASMLAPYVRRAYS